MIEISMLLICGLLGTLIVIVLGTCVTIISAVVAGIMILSILTVWAGTIINSISMEVKFQAEDFQQYKTQEAQRDALVMKYNEDKKVHKTALTKYKDEVQITLVDSYKQFEENLMDKVKDSKLIAMIIKKSGYADVLDKYHQHIINLTDTIKFCDNSINEANKECKVVKLYSSKRMLIRQGKGIFGLHYFYPKYLIFKDNK